MITHEGVKESYVMMHRDEAGQASLCAYVAVDEEVQIAELTRYLKEVLSEYMIPAHFVQWRHFLLL
ncbi:hypothetical protein [Thermoactinomyces sp. DSM 45891]|uniref:AMP-binding enzyme n=1 Tax=Thermoactinomyces sp. DSM 45891 TaxID=1761907 RepID=UPI000930C77F|nr:hypothetical protein [Thermoactinomyces sp. DSM 45891]